MVHYLGRQVPKDGFRVFVYGKDGQQKLVNSYQEYEAQLATGNWFAQLSDMESIVEEVEPVEDVPVKTKPRKKGHD
jgi:hypothetical protein